MYSLILMSAMAGTPDVASFGYGTGCTGCSGVSVSYSASYSYSSCGGCGGCSGPTFPRLSHLASGVGRFARSSYRSAGCHGTTFYSSACYGSCYGSACYGSACYGSCYRSSCFGSACYGSSCFGSGCYGSSCFGCVGSAPVIINGGSYVVPGAPVSAPIGESYGTVSLRGNGTDTVLAARPTVTVEASGDAKATASLSIELPATATLFVDGNLITGGGETRQFHTPELQRGQAFYYEVKAIVEVNGKLEVEEKRVVVKAGESLRESFPKLLASVKAAGGSAVATK